MKVQNDDWRRGRYSGSGEKLAGFPILYIKSLSVH